MLRSRRALRLRCFRRCARSNPRPHRLPAGAAAARRGLDRAAARDDEHSCRKGDPARQAEMFQSAKDAAALSPTTSNRLRYALALATPGHSGSDPVAAQRQLSELLARPETLLPGRALVGDGGVARGRSEAGSAGRKQAIARGEPRTNRAISCWRSIAGCRRNRMKMRDCAKPWTRLKRNSMRSRTSSGPSTIAAQPDRIRPDGTP